MKFCDVCGYNNLNEAVLCRHCGSELDVLIDAEEENLMLHTDYYSVMENNYRIYDNINVVFPRDKYVFVLVTLFFVVFCGWSFVYSHWLYLFLLIIYFFLFAFRLVKILFEWCGVSSLSEYCGELIKNDRIWGLLYIFTGILVFLAPLCLWYNFQEIILLFILVTLGTIFFFGYGIRMFFSDNSFNRTTGLTEITYYLFFIFFPGQAFFWMGYSYFIYNHVLSFSLFGVLLAFFDVLGLISLLFYDKLNSFWPYDVRDGFGMELLFVYAIFASVLPLLALGSYGFGIWGW